MCVGDHVYGQNYLSPSKQHRLTEKENETTQDFVQIDFEVN